ncbi:MAG: hypothetical protein IPH37_06890 [Burkholderiales bacterium]|nr:hypothetical protein [Burkholderiales bacterium]
MKNLERRIEAMEAIEPPAEELTIIRRIVWPGHLDAAIDHIRDDDGKEWTIQPGETEAAFTDRVISATQPNKNGVKRLIASNMELTNAIN